MRAEPIRRLSLPASRPPRHAAEAGHGDEQPGVGGPDLQDADQEDDLERNAHAAEQVRGPGAGGDLAQDRVPEHEREPFADLGSQAGPVARRLRRFLADADGQQRRHRDGVGDRVRRHGAGRADQADQATAQARARHLRERLGRAELAVAVHQVLLGHHHGQVALIGDVEEDGAHAGRDRDRVQLPQREHTEGGGQRHRADDQHPRHVAPDHQPPLGPPVYQGSGRQGDERERGGSGRGQQADLEGGRPEHHDGGQRQGELGDRGTHLADRLPAPQQQEVPVPPQGFRRDRFGDRFCLQLRLLLLWRTLHRLTVPRPRRGCPTGMPGKHLWFLTAFPGRKFASAQETAAGRAGGLWGTSGNEPGRGVGLEGRSGALPSFI